MAKNKKADSVCHNYINVSYLLEGNKFTVQMNLARLSFVCLVIQNTLLILSAKFLAHHIEDQHARIVLFSEAMKLLTCLVAAQCLPERPSIEVSEILRCAPPAIAFSIQSNLLIYAMERLDAPVFQVIQQGKTLGTAILSWYILNTAISTGRWASLILLTIGMTFVGIGSVDPDRTKTATSSSGILATIVASLLSSLASVYFEKILKRPKSLIGTNIHLCCVSLPLSAFIFIIDSPVAVILQSNASVLFISTLSGLGGLMVAIVTKYSGSVTKCVATALSITIGTVISIHLLEFRFTWMGFIGTLFSLLACLLYGGGCKISESEKLSNV